MRRSPRRIAYEPFTPQRLSALEAAGKPVFVNLTASWCVTCLINERVALDSEAVRQAFAERGIVALKGDWTSQNPEITAFCSNSAAAAFRSICSMAARGRTRHAAADLTAASVLDAIGKS